MEPWIHRQPFVSERFYPNHPETLKKEIKGYFESCSKIPFPGNLQALIVPHAGYVFSGKVAASAYCQIDSNKTYHTIFILAPSHYVSLSGASVYSLGNYLTPLGEVEVDNDLVKELMQNNSYFQFSPDAHKKEHSIEVQLPFLQYTLKKPFKIVPILIGTANNAVLKSIAESLRPYFQNTNLFVISSDFSHYPTEKESRKIDFLTKEAIIKNNLLKVEEQINENEKQGIKNLSTSACGLSCIKTLLYLTQKQSNTEILPIKYMNSADSPWGDNNKVVGYWAFAILNKESNDEFHFTEMDKSFLLNTARKAIKDYFETGDSIPADEKDIPDNLKLKCGAFVTLHLKNALKGCIGRFESEVSLYLLVQELAILSATHDNRFTPLMKEELEQTEIEISVLTPLKRINSKNEIQLGVHGIYLKKGMNHGTLLPQVAIEKGWSIDEFLGYCSKNKAGLGWDGWKNAELYVYKAIVFSD